MQIRETLLQSISSSVLKGGRADSEGFEKIFESSSLAKADPSKESSACPDFSNTREVRKENRLLHIGTTSLNQPTVSHLLIVHPEYGKDCWEIIHSELNRNKAYTRIPAGTRIYLDPVSKEISWDGSSMSRASLGGTRAVWNNEKETAGPVMRSGFLPEAYRKSPLLKNEPDDYRHTAPVQKESEYRMIDHHVSIAAARYNLPEELIRGVIRAESDFQVHAVSPAGAQGLMQLMPATARELGVNNPFDIKENIDAGVRYLKKMLNTFNGDLKMALAAYNAGPQTVKNYLGNVPYQETKNYVKRVLSFVNHYE